MIAGYVAATSPGRDYARESGAMLIHDHPSHIPLSNILGRGDLILLLTPVVVPIEQESGQDPFEPLGRGLARYHPWVRHVPYTSRGGITTTHAGFIKRAKAVVFVISGPHIPGQPSQVDLSSIAQAIGEYRPHIVVACCNVQELEPTAASFPTILQLPGYHTHELEAAAGLLFYGQPTQPVQLPSISSLQNKDEPHRWVVKGWNEIGDLPAVYDLWQSCMPRQFNLSRPSLQRLLQRDGYAKHFVARTSETGEVVGFCATYITYQDSKGEVLVGSIAAIIVKESHRDRGIGRILHDEGLKGFQKTRGVTRLQLGSTFPRLLYGLPIDHPSEGWFQRRGWKMDGTVPGTGQEVADWVLAFDEWPTGGFPSIGLTFRPCGFADFDQMLEIVEQESERKGNMAWYDQYAKLADSLSMGDIIIALRGDTIVATAITYIMNSENPSAEDLPWARTISEDTGGVTCICITDDDPATRNAVMARLLDACVQVLRQQGMNRMYIDAVRGGDAGFQSIGFKKWASYRDVWRDA
ncbi:hypothetical protein VMCG_10500 [Cytospora schulzeri]|uniref:N-acetyltransferase domain-containing protein n=1 Tax=Cytospora schulzeri TaxID=448051 RepID=A0A423V9H3_9PEZI|nr:hypothetical protein VMCG_10500 [Valsa malicola]